MSCPSGNGPVVSVVVTRPLIVWVSPVKGLVAVPAHVVVRVMVRVAVEGSGFFGPFVLRGLF